MVATDPSVTPASCRPSPTRAAAFTPAIRTELAAAGGVAVRDDFAASLVRTLWFPVGVFALSFLFMLALPRWTGRRATRGGSTKVSPALAD